MINNNNVKKYKVFPKMFQKKGKGYLKRRRKFVY